MTNPNLAPRRAAGVLFLAAGALSLSACSSAHHTSLREGVNVKHYEVGVCTKQMLTDPSDGSIYYLVLTHDANGTNQSFQIKNTILVGGTRFDATEFYDGLDPDGTYDITTSGYRNGPLGLYPNITQATPAAAQHPEWCHLSTVPHAITPSSVPTPSAS